MGDQQTTFPPIEPQPLRDRLQLRAAVGHWATEDVSEQQLHLPAGIRVGPQAREAGIGSQPLEEPGHGSIHAIESPHLIKQGGAGGAGSDGHRARSLLTPSSRRPRWLDPSTSHNRALITAP
jgi:hypothetical protein